MPEGDGSNTNTGAGGGSGSGGEKTFTQDEVNRIVEERLKRERSKFSDYDDLKAKAAEADKSKSDVQKLTEAVDQLKNDLGEERKQSKRSEVARRTGLSMAKVERLQGDTVDEMLADAEKVFDVKPDQNEPGKGGDTGNGGGQQQNGAGQQAGGGSSNAGQQAGGDGGNAGDGNNRSTEGLREGTVPDATAGKTGEQLAEEVWKRTHGEL